MNRIRHYSYGILALSLLLLVLTPALPSTAALSAEGVVRRAWQRVQRLGVYDFATELTQTQQPGPALANVGRSSSTQTVYMEGHTDQPAQLMEMSLWQNGGNTLTGRDGLEIRIADGKAYGRAIGEESWREVSDFTDAFAPGEDPLGYLAGAENIREVGQETREGLTFTRYAFDLNGPRFAAYMRDQMEQELIAKGELPPGVQLSMADEYVAMSGEGELWLDSQDLPLRLTLHVTYPEEANGDRVSADIRTDFSGYPEAAAANRAGAWLAGTLHLPRTSGEWQQTAHRGGMALGVLGLVVLLITAANSRKLYIAVAVLVIVSTVVTPLLQSQQVAAFSEKASAERTAQEQEQAEAEEAREYRQQVNTSTWNANADPLAAAEAAQSLDLPTELAAAQPSTSAALLTEPTPDPASDADGDGLTYAQETALGTIADNADTDGDGLTDNIEVQGFSYAGKLWYSDPTYYDTDMDGITDVQECPQRQRESQNQLSPDVPCQDTDGDGTPDIFDRDSDNDGLPDKLDYSPTRKLGAADTPFTYETPFHLIINDAQADNPLVVDFQLRPQNPEHLTYVMNVLDWPDGDTKGQVQRAKGNRATFADVAPGGAAREANGDMRLIPMLEIEMNGDTLPLPLTTTLQATAYLENEIAGQIAMTQQPGQPIQLAFNFANTQPYTMVIYADNASCPGGTAAYTFTAVRDGDVRTVSGISLNVLADGKRLMSVSGGGQQVCANLGNVINGPYSDRAVDLAQMQSYGIAVREKTDGGLLAYVPLSVIADETGGGRVGFLGRMYYQPGASWGDAHQMRMVWLVDALVDRCKNRPASYPGTQEQWCSDPNNWDLNQTQVVQTYSDEWFLAGMIAREDHGLDMAVVFEDPATDSAPDVDEYLWHLTEGLGGIFLTASDTNNDGQRDLTIPEIVRRFDSQHNAGVSDEQRWDIPQNALRVLTYAFANADEVATLPMTHTRQLLQTYFTAPDGSAKVSAPTLLFAQEQRARYANLGMSAEAVRTARLGSAATDNQLTLSIPGDVLTQAVYQWAPYRQVNGVWEAMPLDNYFQHFTGVLQPILESDTEAYANLTPEERTKALNAQGVLAQGYYLAVYQSMSALVQKGAALIKPAVPGQDSDYKYVKTGGTVGKVIITIVKSLVKTFIKASISVLKLYVGDFLIKNSGDLLKLLVQCVTPLANLIGGVLSATAWFFKYLTQIRGGEGFVLMVGIAIILAAVVAVACLLAMVSTIALLSSGAAAIVALILSPDTVATFFAIVKLVCSVLTLIVTIIMTIISIVKAVIAVIKAAGDLTAAINIGALVLGAIVAIIAWAIGVVISVGLFAVQVIVLLAFGYNLFSPEVLTLVADLIAELALSIVTLLIGLIPIVGAVLMGLMGVIDAIVGVICTLIPGKDPVAARWFCGGITGFFKVAISSAIYSYAVVVSMKNPQRLQLTSLDTSLADPKQGFKVGQKMTFKVGISNEIDTITVWEATGAGLAYAAIYPQLEGIDTLVRQSTFAYRLQPTKNDFHQDLKLNQNPQIWRQGWHKNPDFLFDPSNTPGAGPYIMTATTASQLTFNQAGMNVTMPAYLSEGYALPAHECWLLGLVSYGYVFFTPKATEFCTIKTSAATNHIDLSSVLEYDIFPATLDEFYALAARDGGYALAWSQTSYPVFPRLKDADGDGLLNAADGGSDPDDRRWDADGDGLSDYFEAQKGTPPLSADADGDGLSDAEELIRKTDPLKADSDGDGLTDADELTGWEFVYGFDAAGQPLRTWVWPDPQVGDADGDGLNDAREKAFGFNPRVPDEGNALAYTAALDEVQPGGGWQASDGVVKPGDTLRYTGAVENRLNARYAQGLFSTALPAGMTGNVAPQNFVLQPLDKTTVSGQVQIAPTAASGDLALAQTAGALVTDPRTASGGASLLLHFEEANGATTFLDESGSFRRHNAICTAGSCPELLEESGIFGRYAFFNNSTVTVADAPDLRSGAFTLSLWYYWRDGSNGPVFLTSKGVGNLEIQLGNGAGDPRLLRVIAAGHPGATLDVLDGAVREAWTHLVVVYTGSAIHVYSNGVLLRSRTDITGGNDLAANTAPLTLGRRSDGGYPFLGSLDEVRLYSRAFTAAEAQALYRRPLMKFSFNRPPTDNRWRDDSGLKYDAYCNSPICLAVQSPEGIYQSAIFFPAPGWGLWTAMPIPFDFTAGQVTLSAWVHPRFMPSSNATLIGSLGYGDRNAAPSLRLNGQTVLFGYGDGVAWREVQWDNVVSLGDWNHLAVTLAGQTAQLYVNGVPQATRGMGGAPRAYRDMMVIGRDFMGLLDEVTLYAHTLTAEEVLAEYRRYAVALDLPLDDAPGSRAFQDATQQSSAACSGASCPVSGVPGRINQAATFDGVDDAVRVANSAALRPAIFSLSAWFQWDDVGTANVQFITGKGLEHFEIHTGGDAGVNGLRVIPAGYTRSYVDVANFIQPGWNHVVVTYDGRNVFVYRNGVQVGSRAGIADSYDPAMDAAPFWVGCRNGGSYPFHGAIDAVQLYNRVLTAAEVQQLYQSAPLFLLRFDEGVGATQFGDAFSSKTAACAGATCPVSVRGQLGNALEFDGMDDRVHGDLASNATDNVSLMAWIRWAGVNGKGQMIAHNGNSSTDGYGLYLAADGTLHLLNGGVSLVAAALKPAQDSWTHVAAVRENGVWKLYVNGSLAPLASNPIPRTPTAAFYVGANNAGGDAFNGRIDHVALYVTALSGVDVDAIYRYQSQWVEERQSFALTVDADKPTSTLQSAAPYRPNRDVVLHVAAADATSAVDKVELGVNGNWTTAPTCRDADAAWCPTFDPTALNGEGVYTLQTRATDRAGNIETPGAGATVYVDATPPTVGATLPTGAIAPQRADALWTVALAGTVNDPALPGGAAGSGVVSVHVALYDASGVTAGAGEQVATVTGAAWAATYAFPAAPTGAYTVSVTASDAVGNARTTAVGVLHLDGAAPTASLDKTNLPTNTITSTLTLRGLVSELPSLTGQVFHLALEENAGATAFYDSNGRGVNGVCSGATCPTSGVAGENGRALDFDGVDDYLTVTPPVTPTEFTLSLWFQWDDLNSSTVQFLGGKDTETFELHTTAGNGLRVIPAGYPETSVDVPGFVQAGWNHVALTYDGSTVIVYRNGAPVGGRGGVTGVDLLADATPFNIGRRGDGTYPFDGQIDDVRLFDRVLEPAEIALLAQSQVAGVSQADVAFTPAMPGSPFYNESAPAGQVLHLPLESAGMDANVSILRDVSGSNAHGICEGTACPTLGTNSPAYVGAQFDGVDDLVTVSDPGGLSLATFSVGGWVRPDQIVADWQVLIAKGNPWGHYRNYGLWIKPNELTLDFGFKSGHDCADYYTYVSQGALPLNAWTYVMMTYDGAALKLYLNGQLDSAVNVTAAPCQTAYPVQIGRLGFGGAAFHGALDDMRVFNRALTAAEIQMLYWGAGPEFRLDFEESTLKSGDGIADSSARGHNGLLYTGDAALKGLTGQVGQGALALDGVDDSVSIAGVPAFAPEQYTLSLWFQWDDTGSDQVQFITARGLEHFEMHTGGGAGVNGLRVIPAGYPETHVDVPNVIQPGWNHVVVTYNGSAVYVYRNGVLAGSRTGITGGDDLTADSAPFLLGRRSDGSGVFDGALDDVRLYARILSAAEIHDLTMQGWQAATLTQNTNGMAHWNAAVPGGLEGNYQIALRGQDAFGNTAGASALRPWQGTIDTFAPRVSLTKATLGAGATLRYQYTCTAEDFALTEAGFVCPCAAPDKTFYQSPWYQAASDAPNLYRLTASCTIGAQSPVAETLTACDKFGNCATTGIGGLAMAPLKVSAVTLDAAITEPADGDVLATTPVTVSGAAYALKALRALTVTADAAVIH
ncbi:MAG TPA: hypothetical protein PKH77_16370, partial [Anaerolineae bacterium]|nr:hypothetical protein [Anaerolineae bacterium]